MSYPPCAHSESDMQSSQDAHATCADGERGTSGEVPGTIIRLFEEQAARTPEAIALVCNGRSLTYGQLDDRAKRLAHRLQNMGVGAETLVGIFMGRSVEMVAALLATLKAGGAMSRSIRIIRESGSPWCSRIAGPRSCSRPAAIGGSCRRSQAASSRSTPRRRTTPIRPMGRSHAPRPAPIWLMSSTRRARQASRRG